MTKHKSLTHPQFFKLCETFREKFEVLKPTDKTDLARKMSELTGFTVPVNAVENMIEATKLPITFHRKTRSGLKNNTRNHIRTLTRAVIALYKRFGDEVPQGLIDVQEYYSGREKQEEKDGKVDTPATAAAPTAPETPPIPVAAVPPTKTIPVVNQPKK